MKRIEIRAIEESEVWVAVCEARILALLAINEDSVEQLYVDPTVQREGIGTALLDFAKSRSPDRLGLHTHQSNVSARAFYEAAGFRAVEFGISPAPESEPDVRYEWRSGGTQ